MLAKLKLPLLATIWYKFSYYFFKILFKSYTKITRHFRLLKSWYVFEQVIFFPLISIFRIKGDGPNDLLTLHSFIKVSHMFGRSS